MAAHDLLRYALIVLSGALLCNGVPHLVSGLRGERFPTPLTRLRGNPDSSALANLLWGVANLSLGVTMMLRRLLGVRLDPAALLLLAGFVAMGVFLSLYFSRTRTT